MSAAAPGQAQYQYTLSDSDLTELDTWAPKLLRRLESRAASSRTSAPISSRRAARSI